MSFKVMWLAQCIQIHFVRGITYDYEQILKIISLIFVLLTLLLFYLLFGL